MDHAANISRLQQHRAFAARRRSGRGGFTLVELLVVVAIIGVLISIVWKGSSYLVGGSKARETDALLKRLDQALTQFESEKPFTRVPGYLDRYNDFPPDELGVFSGGATDRPLYEAGAFPGVSIVGPGAALNNVPAAEMNRFVAPLSGMPAKRTVEPFILAIRQASPAASLILDGVSDKFRVVEKDTSIPAAVFRPANGAVKPLEYYVDSWGNPLEYFAAARIRKPPPQPSPSEYLSMKLIIAANKRPVFASYGPNGTDQLDSAMNITLQTDYNAGTDITDKANDDNIYSVEGVRERIRASY